MDWPKRERKEVGVGVVVSGAGWVSCGSSWGWTGTGGVAGTREEE